MSSLFSSKFVRIVKTLSPEEWKSFELWLRSPWANSNKNLVRLLDKLKKYSPEFTDAKLTKEKLFKQVLPDGKFSLRRMNNLLSEGYLAAERFLIFQNLSIQQNLQKNLLTKELQSRYLDEWFFKDVELEIERLEGMPVKEWEDHLQLFQLHRRVYHHPNQSSRMLPGSATIVRMGEELDLLYLLERAAIINEKIFRNRILKNENHEIEEELEQWRASSKGIDHIAIDFYRRRFAYEDEKMLEQYLALRELFFTHFEELNRKEQKLHLLSLLNDTTFLAKATLLEITETLPLYELGLKTQIILHQGKLTLNTFVAIVAASNTKGRFEFTRSFIETYVEKLDNELQADASRWAIAHTFYWQKHLEECLDLLLQGEFRLPYFQRISRILNTQVYFDLYLKDNSYQEYLFNFFDAYEKWLTRSKIRGRFNIKSHLRFVQLSRTLAKAYGDVNFKANKIKELLNNERNIQASNWIKSKIKEIVLLKKGKA